MMIGSGDVDNIDSDMVRWWCDGDEDDDDDDDDVDVGDLFRNQWILHLFLNLSHQNFFS